jgi:opacity protein-like surface antigen
VTYFSSDASGTEDNVDVDFDGFADGDIDATGKTTELGVGGRKWFEGDGDVRFFFEGGVVRISAELSADFVNTNTPVSLSDSGSTIGFWFGGGLGYQVNETISVGAIARFSQGDVTLFEEKGDAGGTILAVTLQYHSE